MNEPPFDEEHHSRPIRKGPAKRRSRKAPAGVVALTTKGVVPSIFLSHNSADKPFTRRLAHRLHKAGVRVWLDEAELRVGDSLIAKLSSAIQEMDYVGAVISRTSVTSHWVEQELRLAMAKEISSQRVTVLPILIDDVALPAYLVDKVYADFKDVQCFEESLLRLLVAVGKLTLPEPGNDLLGLLHLRFDTTRMFRAGDLLLGPRGAGKRAALRGMRSIVSHVYYRVLIFWHENGLTKTSSMHLIADWSEVGILANMLQHSDPAAPNAIFVGRGTPPEIVERVLSGLPYTPSYIFPYNYASTECGAMSDYSISIGLRADFHGANPGAALMARPLKESDFKALTDKNASTQGRQSLLDRLAS